MTAIRTWPSGTCGSRSCVTRTTSGPPVVVTTTARIARLPPTAASSIRACPRKRCHRSGPAQSSDNHGRHQPEQAAPERAAPFRSRGPICSRGCPMVRAVTPHPRGAATGDPASEHPSARRRTRRRTRAPLRAPTRIRRATGTPRHLQRPNRPRLANRASEPGHDVDAVVAEDARLRQARSNRDRGAWRRVAPFAPSSLRPAPTSAARCSSRAREVGRPLAPRLSASSDRRIDSGAQSSRWSSRMV
jgi:hypothetical protein